MVFRRVPRPSALRGRRNVSAIPCLQMESRSETTPEWPWCNWRKVLPAILFSAATGGVSGWQVHFSLLRPGMGNALDDLFLSDTSVSNQSQHAFWSDPTVSDAKIFVTAEYVWGPDESHYSDHRYIISAYVLKPSSLLDGRYYYLDDRYMTVRKYDRENADVLNSEKNEILARLRRVKFSEPRQ